MEDDQLSVLGLATSSLVSAHAAMQQAVSNTTTTTNTSSSSSSSTEPDMQQTSLQGAGQASAQPLSHVYPLVARRIQEVVVHLASVLQQCVVASGPSTAAAARGGQRDALRGADQSTGATDLPTVRPGALLGNPHARAAAIELCRKLKQVLLPSEHM